ncbi:MAG: methyl-accepting chemotaxis protein [Nitrospira sp.]
MMNILNNLKTKAKLLLSSGMICLALLIVGGMSIAGLMHLSDRIETIFKINVLPLKQLGELQGASNRMSSLVAWHILGRDAATMKKWMAEIAKLDDRIDKFQADYASIIVTESEQKTFDKLKAEWAGYKEIRTKVLTLSDNYSKDAASELQDTQLAEKLAQLLDSVNALVEENEGQAQENHESSRSAAMTLTIFMIALIVGALALSLFGNWAISKFLVSGLENVLEAATQLQRGNLGYRSTVTTAEEIGQLAQAFNQMAGSLEAASAKQAEALATQAAEMSGVTNALGQSQMVIEFKLDGTVLTANENFLTTLGYRLDDISGRHHRMFCDPVFTATGDYVAFWQKLNRGEFNSAVHLWLGQGGKEFWFQNAFTPILDTHGKLTKIMTFATDVTARRQRNAEYEGKIAAIMKLQAVIEFTLDGTVVDANQQFLECTGYSFDEVKGQHHRMFYDAPSTNTSEYTAFWQKFSRNEADTGVYHLQAKGGKELWLQASYTPILNANGVAYKVVMYATDITVQTQAQATLQACMTEAQDTLFALANGDLTQSMQGVYAGELDKIKSSINTALTNLTATIATVHQAVEGVTAGAEQIADANKDLSQRTSQQAAALEETSASMEEMTSTVKQNADNAKQADQLAINARATADKGRVVTQQAVGAMDEINKSSKKIADIITVIDEIAFQTNLLALNAAVEAARAGEHGRGFAVVATEVRNLAQRSATAAKEIKGLIKESIQRVNDGSELVNQSGKTLEEIVNSVKRVTDIIAEISAASQEQAIGIDQVNRAIMAMDQATQQNVGVVEETANAAQSMQDQARELLQQVQAFKIAPGRHAEPVSVMPSTVKPMVRSVAHEGGRSAKNSAMASALARKVPVGETVQHNQGHHGPNDSFEEF